MGNFESIKLNLVPDGKMPVLHCSQYDKGTVKRVYLYNGDRPYNLTDETVEINVRKRDRKIVTADLDYTPGQRYVDIITTEQMCAVVGKNEAEIRILKGPYNEIDVGTLNFYIEIEKSPLENGLESQSEINNLNRQIHDQVVIELRDRGAEDTGYNNAYSGLDATNVQSAIDEVNDKVDNIPVIDAYTKTEADDKFATKTELAGKADASSVYDKQTVDDKLGEKADTSYVNTELGKKADKSNTYTKSEVNTIADGKANTSDVYNKSETYSKSEVDTLIDDLPEAMIFKGTLGVGGTIQTLPTASASNEGWTYKVITDGTYAGQSAKVGDVFTSNGSAWVLIPSGDEDNDTWRAIKVNGVEKLGNGISSGNVDFEDTDNVKFSFEANGNKVKVSLSGIDTSEQVNEKVAGLIDDEAASESKVYSSSKVTELVNAKASIDDTAEVNNKVWSSKKTYDEIVAILPTGTASGSIANFDTDLELPLKEAKVTIPADANGVSECKVGYVDFNELAKPITSGNYGTNYTHTSTLTYSNGVVTSTANSGVDINTNISFIEDHIYYSFATLRASFAATNLTFRLANPTQILKNLTTVANQTFKTSLIFKATGASTLIQFYRATNQNDTLELSKFNVIDITKAFGSTIADFLYSLPDNGLSYIEAIFNKDYYNYNAGGSIVSVESVNGSYYPNADVSFGSSITEGGVLDLTSGILTVNTTPPTTIQCEPTSIKTLNGLNSIWSDVGTTEVVYRKSVDKAIAELQALILG